MFIFNRFGSIYLLEQRLEAAARELARPISRTLVDLISRCVATERDDRFGSVGEVLQQLLLCQPSFHWGCQNARDWWQASPIAAVVVEQTRADIPAVSRRELDETQAFTLPNGKAKPPYIE